MIIVGVVILLASPEIVSFLMIYFEQTAGNVFGWIADTVWLALFIWAWSPYAPIIILFCCLLVTISDEEQLYQYNQRSFFDDSDIIERQDELEKELEGAKEQYYLISYKYPVARFGEKELEENITITLYEDTNIIKMTVAGESIKGISIPEAFLIFYYEISVEDMNFYRSLVGSAKNEI